jgi:hypothetical protein
MFVQQRIVPEEADALVGSGGIVDTDRPEVGVLTHEEDTSILYVT